MQLLPSLISLLLIGVYILCTIFIVQVLTFETDTWIIRYKSLWIAGLIFLSSLGLVFSIQELFQDDFEERNAPKYIRITEPIYRLQP